MTFLSNREVEAARVICSLVAEGSHFGARWRGLGGSDLKDSGLALWIGDVVGGARFWVACLGTGSAFS